MLANLNSRTKLRESTTGHDDVMLSIPLSITERGRTNDALHALSHSQTGSMTKNTVRRACFSPLQIRSWPRSHY